MYDSCPSLLLGIKCSYYKIEVVYNAVLLKDLGILYIF